MRLMGRRRRPPADSMTVVEHLEELRTRLIVSAAAIVLLSVVGFLFFDGIFGLLLQPYCSALEQLPREARPLGENCRLVFSSPVDPFLTRLKIALLSGFLLALPVVLWQLWRFVTPGLTRRERRMSIPFVLASVALFAGGAAFALWIIPRGLSLLFSFGGETLVPLLTVDRYLSFLIVLMLVFGVSFEFPVLLIFLAAVGVITTAQMRQWRRYAYFGTAVFAAIATPTQDPYTMLLMWVPLIAFYEIALLVARLFKR